MPNNLRIALGTTKITATPSILSLLGAGVYALAVIACIGAVRQAPAAGRNRAHRRRWWGLALFFALLIVMRILGLEEIFRSEIRDILQSAGNYSDRRAWQLPLVLTVVFIAVVAGGVVIRRFMTLRFGLRELSVRVALASALVMTVLITLRIISLHATDRVLYGPLKVSWIVDLGTTTAVIACAVFYRHRSLAGSSKAL